MSQSLQPVSESRRLSQPPPGVLRRKAALGQHHGRTAPKLSFVCPPEQIVSVFTDFEFRIDRSLQVLFMFAFKDKLDDRRIAFDAARTTGGVDEFLRGTRTAFPFAFQVSFPAR